jgi:ParB family transcriptional regulator, chromosome partitioning protein
MSAIQPETPTLQLRDLDIASIDPNPANPRLIFPQDELDKLTGSIALEGVLVPILVYPKGDRYVLVDGERRFKCASRLGHEKIKAVITDERPEKDTLVQMFNIHLIREPWRDMPTALALGRLVDALRASGQEEVTDADLRDLTGMSVDKIRQLRFALALPPEWQKHIEDGEITLNWFWELQKNVIKPLANKRPALFEDLGEHDITQAFVNKRLQSITATDSVSFRKIRPIINFAADDAEAGGDGKSVVDETLRDLVKDPNLTIDDAYEDTVQIMVELDKLDRRTKATAANFERLLHRARNDEERNIIRQIANDLIAQLTQILASA